PGSAAAAPSKFILYFALEHLALGARNYSFRSAIDWAAGGAKPTDEVMIVTGGMTLRIVRPLLPAGNHLQEEIRHVMEDFSSEDFWGNGEAARIEELGRLARINPDLAAAMANSYASIDFDYTRRSLDNLKGLMTLFDKVAGTKNLVFFG